MTKCPPMTGSDGLLSMGKWYELRPSWRARFSAFRVPHSEFDQPASFPDCVKTGAWILLKTRAAHELSAHCVFHGGNHPAADAFPMFGVPALAGAGGPPEGGTPNSTLFTQSVTWAATARFPRCRSTRWARAGRRAWAGSRGSSRPPCSSFDRPHRRSSPSCCSQDA